MRHRAGRRTAALLTATAVLAAAAGCSIGTDSEPRALVVSTTTTSTPSAPSTGGASAQLWYLRDGALVPAGVSLPDHTVSTTIGALFATPDPAVKSQELTSSVPIDTELSNLDINEGVLTVNLSKEFDNVVGPSRQQAIAQIVLTATEFVSVSKVRFKVDGKAVQVATPTRGDATTVTACDYASLLGDPAELAQSGLTNESMQQLDQRVATLQETCPASK